YSETSFELSPLSRAIRQSAPGQPWQITGTKTTTTAYGTNGSYEVLIWKFNGTNLVASSYYAAGELTKVTQTNEEGNSVTPYTDKFGRTILQKSSTGSTTANTYSVYDATGNLTHQISPEAVKKAT